MSMPRYTCIESTETSSRSRCRRARARASADLPDAVVPTTARCRPLTGWAALPPATARTCAADSPAGSKRTSHHVAPAATHGSGSSSWQSLHRDVPRCRVCGAMLLAVGDLDRELVGDGQPDREPTVPTRPLGAPGRDSGSVTPPRWGCGAAARAGAGAGRRSPPRPATSDRCARGRRRAAWPGRGRPSPHRSETARHLGRHRARRRRRAGRCSADRGSRLDGPAPGCGGGRWA